MKLLAASDKLAVAGRVQSVKVVELIMINCKVKVIEASEEERDEAL